MAENESTQQWRRCSSCKKPIAFRDEYWVCNVSTCNRKNSAFVFCTVSCWDAHLGVVRHRESWAEERRAPAREEAARQETAEKPARAPKRTIAASSPRESSAPKAQDDLPIDTLIVMSKLKQYVKARAGLSTSDRVLGPLSDAVRKLCDEAIENAIASERKTLMDRDFKK